MRSPARGRDAARASQVRTMMRAASAAAPGDDRVLGPALPANKQVTQAIRVGDVGDDRPVAFGGSVWVTDQEKATLTRVDPSTNAVTSTLPLGGPPQDVLFAGAAWVTLPGQGVVLRIDPETAAITRIRVRGKPANLAFGSGTLWVTDPATTGWPGWTRSSWPERRCRVGRLPGLRRRRRHVGLGSGRVQGSTRSSGSTRPAAKSADHQDRPDPGGPDRLQRVGVGRQPGRQHHLANRGLRDARSTGGGC
jgi:hypothetical protein